MFYGLGDGLNLRGIMTKQAAIYARVSSDEQSAKGYSIPTQIDACNRFVASKGFEIAGIFQDDISGAMAISARPEGRNLQQAIETRLVRAVIVYQVDRLSRDIVDLLTTVRDWLRMGVEIYSLDVGQIKSELDIVLVIKGWQGSDERQKIAERTKRGKDGKAKAGKVPGVGTPPYGYIYQNGEFIINEQQAQVIRMIFDWYVNGDENGRMMSLQSIAQRLTEMGIPRPGDSKSISWKQGMKERAQGKVWNGQIWQHSTVQKLIVKEIYTGDYYYGQTIGEDGRGGKRPREEQIQIEIPAIISRELWQLAQERRVYNSRVAKRRTKANYLLRGGLLYCGCGRVMVGIGKGKWYVCTKRYFPTGNQDPCTEPLVKAPVVEYIAWNYVLNLLTNADEFEIKLKEAQAMEAEQQEPKLRELEHVKALMIDTEHEAEQVADTLSKVKGIVGEKLQAQADEIDRRYQVLQVRKGKLEAELQTKLTDEKIHNLIQYREAVALGLNNPKPDERRTWLELLQTKVTVSNGTAVVTCRISQEGQRFDLSTGYSISRNWEAN
jgi:site-specific DNA recombinase